ncbi:MAG: hypothetical protein AAGN66_28355 [Acidobacteriota bacterium]
MSESYSEHASDRMRDATKAWAEATLRSLKQYRLLVARQLKEDPASEMLQEMMKIALQSIVQTHAFGREARHHFLKSQIELIDAQIARLEALIRGSDP